MTIKNLIQVVEPTPEIELLFTRIVTISLPENVRPSNLDDAVFRPFTGGVPIAARSLAPR